MLTAPEIVALMRQAVPPGRETLDDASLTRLRELTRALLEAKPDAQQEYARFLAISERALPLPDDELYLWMLDSTLGPERPAADQLLDLFRMCLKLTAIHRRFTCFP